MLGQRRVCVASLLEGCLDALDGGGQVVERAATAGTRDELRLRGAQARGLQQGVGHRNLVLGRFAEADADGVADAVDEQGTDAHGTLQAAVLALAGFRDAEVEGEGHAFGLHGAAQQAHALHHHHGVGGFDADDDIQELLLHAHAQELHARLHDAGGRVAIARHDAVGERAVVHADAHGGAMLTADVEEGHEAVLNLAELGGVLLVGIF